MKHLFLVVAFALAAPSHLHAQATNPLDDVRVLYEQAAYEEALAQLAKVTSDVPVGRVEQYRAFCLIALGRVDEASTAVARSVAADPLLVPSASDASPRVRAFFSEARRRALPEITRDAYTRAKAAYSAKNFAAAATGFGRVIALADAAAGDTDELGDVRLLAQEFLELSKNAVVAAPSPVPPLASGATATKPGGASKSGNAGRTRGPVAIRQRMPSWNQQATPRNTAGLLHITIDDQGTVTSAIMVTPTDLFYDNEVLVAAKQWKYEPAMSNGRPIPSEKDITFVLKR
jgi:TonB family protein